ncbi:hypothetical protein SOVF_213470, partial [Spinacia oleracea]
YTLTQPSLCALCNLHTCITAGELIYLLQSGMRGDGRYGRYYREGRPFGQRDWRGYSWEANHHHSGPANEVGRPHSVNDQRSVGDSAVPASHPNSDLRDQFRT